MSRAEGWLADLKLSPNQHFMHGLVKMSESRPLMELRKLKVMADTFDNDAANRAIVLPGVFFLGVLPSGHSRRPCTYSL